MKARSSMCRETPLSRFDGLAGIGLCSVYKNNLHNMVLNLFFCCVIKLLIVL